MRIVERGLLEKALSELKLNLSGLMDPVRAKQLGKQVGADAIVTGTITDLGSVVKINARMIEVERGDVLSVAGAEVTKDPVIAQLIGQLLSGPPEAPPEPKEATQKPAIESQPPVKALKYQEFPKLRVEVEDLRVGNKIIVSLAYINKSNENLIIAMDATSYDRSYLLDNQANRYGLEQASGLDGGWRGSGSFFVEATRFLTLPPNERTSVIMSFGITSGYPPGEGSTFDLMLAQVFASGRPEDEPRQYRRIGSLNIVIRKIAPQ